MLSEIDIKFPSVTFAHHIIGIYFTYNKMIILFLA